MKIRTVLSRLLPGVGLLLLFDALAPYSLGTNPVRAASAQTNPPILQEIRGGRAMGTLTRGKVK